MNSYLRRKNRGKERRKRWSRNATAARLRNMGTRFDAGLAALESELSSEPPMLLVSGKWQAEATLTLEIAHCPGDARLFLARFNGVDKGILSATKIARLVRKLVSSKR